MISVIKPLLIVLVLVRGPGGLTSQQCLQTFKDNQRIYAAKHTPLKLKSFIIMRTNYPAQSTSNHDTLFYFERWFKRRYQYKNAVKLVSLPPWIMNGKSYIGGVAACTCCWRDADNAAIFNQMMVNSEGQNRYYHSVTAMGHELGHLVGAEHDASLPATLMHPDALVQTGNRALPLSTKSVLEMRRCKQ